MNNGEILYLNIGTENFSAEDILFRHSRKNAVKIKEYIEKQLKQDELGEQLTFISANPFIGSK